MFRVSRVTYLAAMERDSVDHIKICGPAEPIRYFPFGDHANSLNAWQVSYRPHHNVSHTAFGPSEAYVCALLQPSRFMIPMSAIRGLVYSDHETYRLS